MTRRTKAWTDGELALIERERRAWLAVGMSTARADIPATQQTIGAIYAHMGKPTPFVWVTPGPLAAHVAMTQWQTLRDSLYASLGDSLGASLRASLYDSLYASLGDSLYASLGDSLGASLYDSLYASLGASLGDSLGASLRASLRASLYASLGDSLGEAKIEYRPTWLWGAHDAYWVGCYRTAQQLGVPFKPDDLRVIGWWDTLARSCLWWWPFANGVVVCDRPTVCRMEATGTGPAERWRLHAPDGPALAFADGYALYAWHGVRVTQQIIERPETLTRDHLVQEQNEEVRRAMFERLGYAQAVQVLGATPVQADDYGTLYEIPGDPPIKLVSMVNGTREPDGTYKTYWESAPPHVTTAREYQAWAYYLDRAEDYQPTERT